MKMFRAVVTIAVMSVIVVGVHADEQKGKRKGKRQANVPSATQRLVADLDLTTEQKEKVAAIDKQFAGKLTELQKKQDALLTEEQKKARQEIQKTNREQKKTGADARKAVEAALNLTEEQQTQMKEVQQARAAVTKDVRTALEKILTAEQLEKMPKPARTANARGKKKKADSDK